MPITIDIRFADDGGNWHEFAVVPNDGFDTINHSDQVEYRIDRSTASHVELPDLVDMSGRRLWHFEWLKAGQPGGLLVRRMMDFQSISDDLLVLRTADQAGRPIGS